MSKSEERPAAVLTWPFPHAPHVAAQVKQGIDALCKKLGISRIYVPYEGRQREDNRKEIEEQLKTLNKNSVADILPVKTRCGDTADRWREGILRARDDGIDIVFVFPGDWADNPTSDNFKGWRKMLEAAGPTTLVIGDYTTANEFKTEFDAKFVDPVLHVLYPDRVVELKHLGLTKYRSECFVIGGEFFDQFESSSRRHWGSDPTIQLLIYGLGKKDLLVAKPVHFGTFKDDDASRAGYGMPRQVVRLIARLVLDRFSELSANDDAVGGRRSLIEAVRRTFYEALDPERFVPPLEVTQTKIAGFEPRWARFRGYSLLFDSPDESLQFGEPINSGVADVHEFYARLWSVLDKIGCEKLTREYVFAALPPSSAHVTLFDGLNESNARKVKKELRDEVQRIVAAMPTVSKEDQDHFAWILNCQALNALQGPIKFRFKALEVFGNEALVATLDAVDKSVFEVFQAARRNLMDSAIQHFGVSTTQDRWTPHITLGYFANRDAGAIATKRLAHWSDIAQCVVGAKHIEFQGASLYSFKTMTEFVKLY